MKDFAASDFDPKSFVSSVTGDLLATQAGHYTFDPQPFQENLSNTIEHLRRLESAAERNVEDSRKETEEAEAKHKDNMENMQAVLTAIFNRYKRLDRMVQGISHHAVRLGHNLQRVDGQKTAAVDGKQIIEHFLAFRSGNLHNIDPSFSRDSAPALRKAAGIVQHLLAVCDALHLKDDDPGYKLITQRAGEIETDLLEFFEEAVEEGDTDEMKSLAETLWNFPNQNVIAMIRYKTVSKLDRSVSLYSNSYLLFGRGEGFSYLAACCLLCGFIVFLPSPLTDLYCPSPPPSPPKNNK